MSQGAPGARGSSQTRDARPRARGRASAEVGWTAPPGCRDAADGAAWLEGHGPASAPVRFHALLCARARVPWRGPSLLIRSRPIQGRTSQLSTSTSRCARPPPHEPYDRSRQARHRPGATCRPQPGTRSSQAQRGGRPQPGTTAVPRPARRPSRPGTTASTARRAVLPTDRQRPLRPHAGTVADRSRKRDDAGHLMASRVMGWQVRDSNPRSSRS